LEIHCLKEEENEEEDEDEDEDEDEQKIGYSLQIEEGANSNLYKSR
jgi:hypothetical protein